MKTILASDIGGTESRFGHFVASKRRGLSLIDSISLKTSDADSFEGLLGMLEGSGFYLNAKNADILVFAVAGPVEDGKRCRPPYIKWVIDISKLKHAYMINDFHAQAYACISQAGSAAEFILNGRRPPSTQIAVMGAGTALGKAALIPDAAGNYIVMSSEGGHADFAFQTNEAEYAEFMKREMDSPRITQNMVLSGGGLCLLYKYLYGIELEAQDISSRLSTSPEAMSWMARFFGRSARDFVLETAAWGGLYLTGGVLCKNPAILKDSEFESQFRSAHTLKHMMDNVPVYHMADPLSGLWGAAAYGLSKCS